MYKNYLITALRNFQRNRTLLLINLGDLSIGIAAVLLIGMNIYTATHYDNFHKNKSSLYRTGFRQWQNGKIVEDIAQFSPPFGQDAQNEFPEIKSFTRISSKRIAYISYNDKTIKVNNIHHADSNFFHLFSYKLLKGDPATVLSEPYSIVLTVETAKKLFGMKEEGLGKVVRLDNQTDYTVTGIAQEPPSNSHLAYNALLSFITLYKEPGNFMDWDGGNQYSTYFQLMDGANSQSLEKKFPSFMWKHINEQYSKVGARVDAYLQPIQNIHLRFSDNSGSLRTNIYVLSAIALLILLISCVNYINLITTQAFSRFKEVGVRKVLGAVRSQLIKQFLIESVLMTLIAFIIACVLVILASPVYQQLLGEKLPSVSLSVTPALLLLFIIIMIVGVIAGSYIAFYLSSFKVIKIFKALLPRSGQSIFRKGLIITQFVISIGLMSCTLVAALQLKYSKNINPGYDRDHILILPLIGNKTKENYTLVQQQLSQITEVQQVSALSEIPYDGIASNGFIPEDNTKAIMIHQLDADENFLKTFNMKLVTGNYFSKDYPTSKEGFIINETLAKTLEWQNPLGKTISRNGAHEVIGIIKDFHFASLHDKIEPLIITNKPWGNHYSYLAIKYQTDNISAFLSHIKQIWRNSFSDAPFDYWFLDEAFNNIYKSEERFQKIFLYFSVLSILLTLAGAFGLTALTLKQRTQQLGIMKIMGARIADILIISVKDFVWLIVTAALIATPLAWYYIHEWLQDFAYHISIRWWMFAICGVIILLISVFTISFVAIKAAIGNPVDSLRTE
jgi:putative ABC transport system permease protein